MGTCINQLKIEIITHGEILFRDLIRAINIKLGHWNFPLESQLKWIVEHMNDRDMHIFLKKGSKDCAYMTLSMVNGIIDGVDTSFYGVGCVCSVHPGNGEGGLLMNQVNAYILNQNQRGLLFCKDNLVNFYKKYGWHLIPKQCVEFHLDTSDNINVMVFNCDIPSRFKYVDRVF